MSRFPKRTKIQKPVNEELLGRLFHQLGGCWGAVGGRWPSQKVNCRHFFRLPDWRDSRRVHMWSVCVCMYVRLAHFQNGMCCFSVFEIYSWRCEKLYDVLWKFSEYFQNKRYVLLSFFYGWIYHYLFLFNSIVTGLYRKYYISRILWYEKKYNLWFEFYV